MKFDYNYDFDYRSQKTLDYNYDYDYLTIFFSDYDYDFNYTPLIFLIMIMIICPLTDQLRLQFWLQISDYNYDYDYKKTHYRIQYKHISISETCSVHIYYNMYKKDVCLTYTCYKHIAFLQLIVKYIHQLASLQVDIAEILAWRFC
jgi:hypothetical protein